METKLTKRIQIGSLFWRRIEKWSFLCLVSFNVWVDVVTHYVLTQAQHLTDWLASIANNKWMKATVNKLYDTAEQVAEIQTILHLLIIGSTILSVILWIQIVRALLFVVADYQVTWEEKEKHLWLPIVGICIVNIGIYFLLKGVWWP